MVEPKIVTLEELKAHSKKDDFYLLLHNKVYDVSKFIDEHPGGDEVILAEAGKDATEAFEDVGHSDEARDMLKKMAVGDFEGPAGKPAWSGASTQSPSAPASPPNPTNSYTFFIPLAVLGAYFAWRFYLTS